MTLSLNFNAGARRAHANLVTVDRLLQRSLDRLSSGERIRRAADDPSAMVLSNGMRHQIEGISQAIQNCEEGVSMVQTAEGGMDGISALLTRLRSLTIRAANEATNDVPQLTALQDEMDNAIASVTRIATDTRFGKVPLLQGALMDNALSTEAKAWYRGVVQDATRLPGGIQDASTIAMGPPTIGTTSPGQLQVAFAAGTPPATALTALVQEGVALSTLTVGTVLDITGPDGSTSITLGTLGVTDTLGGVLTAINTATPATGVTATYDQTSGRVTLSATQAGTFAVSVDQTMSAGTAALFDTVAGTTAAAIASNTFVTTPQRGHLEVSLDGRPAGTTRLANLTQAGIAFSGTMPVGTQMTIVGPRGATVIPLGGTTTIDQLTATVNAAASTTGVTAHYEATTGIFSVDAEGPGAFSVSVNNPMETGGSAFLDASAGISAAQVADNGLIRPSSDLRRERMAVVLRSGGGAVPSGTAAIQGLTQNGTTLSSVGGMLTIRGVTGSVDLSLSPTLTIDDLVARINASSSRSGVRAVYDTVLGELALENIGFGRGVLSAQASQDMSGGGDVGLMDLDTTSASANPLQGPRDEFRMSFVSRTAPAVTGFPSATDSLQGLEVAGTAIDATDGRSFTIFGPDGSQDTLALETPATGAALAAFVAQQDCDPPLQWTPDNAGGGTLVFDPLGTPQTLAVTANTTAQQLATFLNPFNAGATPSHLALTVQAGELVATYDDTVNPATVGRMVIGGTTIQDVLDFINQNAEVAGLAASYDAASGALSVTSSRGSFNLASEKLTTAAVDVGLLDRNTASMTDTGGTKVSSAPNATMLMQFTDAAGVARTVLLTQEPGLDGGLGFINLNAGPEMVPPFTGWQAGAFRATVRDTTVARSFDATLAVATSVQTATRISTTYIHSGPLATQRIGIEIADLRASALGYTAMRAELASTDPHKPLVEKQLLDLQDLQDLQALLNGNAQEALRIIDAAIDEVTNARGRVGAVQANAIEATADSLLVSYNNLSDSESRLRDTDYAWESAQYSRHQIIYQAATAMLAQANQVPQTVVQRLLQ